MEDLSSILWGVIIIGAMVLNFVSQSRKSRGKRSGTPPQHGEAWPSIPWDDGRETAGRQDPVPGSGKSSESSTLPTGMPAFPAQPEQMREREQEQKRERVQRQEQERMREREQGQKRERVQEQEQKRERERVREWEQKRESGSTPWPEEVIRRLAGADPGDSHKGPWNDAPQPVSADFPGQYRHSAERNSAEYDTGLNGRKTAVPGVSAAKDPRGQETGQSGPMETATGKEGGEAGKQANEIAGEFDLRRAVIYSEILKPKFEE